MTRASLACVIAIAACSAQEPIATLDHQRSPARAHTPRAAVEPAAQAAAAAAAPAAAAASLFDRLGGLAAIQAVVADFVGRTTTDPRIKERFFNTDAAHLQKMLVEQVCQATGGPCSYSGHDMRTTHGGMELVDEEWNALVEDLVAALDAFSVPDREKGELLGALGGMKPEVVAPAGSLRPLPRRGLARAARLAAHVAPRARELLRLAVEAGRRGQRSYAEQLFTRAELLTGPRALAAAAPVFRHGAPPRVTTPPDKVASSTPQPTGAVGSSDEEEDAARGAQLSSLEGAVLSGGEPLRGLGVVMLTPIGRPARRRTPKQRVIEQRGRVFAPHVMAVPVGSTISFPNFDPFFHNVFSLSASAAFDLGLYPSGATREVTFRKEGIVRLGCNLHSSMAGYVIVVSAPHYAVTGADGAFAFRRLAPGTYRMQAWGEGSAAPTESRIVIGPGVNRASIPLAAATAVDRNPNKFGEAR
ncbi:MAG TPA: hypothetical protein VMZ28_08715 [Kofleriaceae bacterium]|nr:hypothetical protein [Kofleriaceae bacterium]